MTYRPAEKAIGREIASVGSEEEVGSVPGNPNRSLFADRVNARTQISRWTPLVVLGAETDQIIAGAMPARRAIG